MGAYRACRHQRVAKLVRLNQADQVVTPFFAVRVRDHAGHRDLGAGPRRIGQLDLRFE